MKANRFKRRLITILSADAVGYSRLMNDDEEETIRTLQAYRQVFAESITENHGRLIDSPGDNLLAAFDSVVDALRCALDVQQELGDRNTDLSRQREMHFRIGINLGDVIEDAGRLYGDGVNIAARLESLAEPGGITISGTVFDQVKNKIANRIEFTGEQQVKNIPEPIRTYRVATHSDSLPREEMNVNHRLQPLKRTRRLLFFGIMAAIAACLAYWIAASYRTRSDRMIGDDSLPRQSTRKASIAVLPFNNLSDDVEQEYFSDGITNDIITDLSKFRELLVIASNTVFLYKDQTVDVKAVGRDLHVDFVMEGSVQRAGDTVRINVQLIDASNGTHVWAERYHRDYAEIFELQGEIVQTIVAKLADKTLQYEQARALRKKPKDLLAYDYLLRGYALYHRGSRSAYAEAKAMFSKAVALDPLYAAAYVGLGELEYGKVSYGWTEFPETALDKALALGYRALELDPSNAAAHSLLSSVYTFQNKLELAIKKAERAIQLNPNLAVSYSDLGWALLWSGRVSEAIDALEMSLRLDVAMPREIWFHLGMAYYLREEYEKASDILEEGLTRRPGFPGYHIGLAAAYAKMGRRDAAQREATAVRRSDPFFKVASFGSGFRQADHRQAIAEGLREAGLE